MANHRLPSSTTGNSCGALLADIYLQDQPLRAAAPEAEAVDSAAGPAAAADDAEGALAYETQRRMFESREAAVAEAAPPPNDFPRGGAWGSATTGDVGRIAQPPGFTTRTGSSRIPRECPSTTTF